MNEPNTTIENTQTEGDCSPASCSLGEALPAEIEKCTEIMLAAKECGPGGIFLVPTIKADIAAANKAMIEGDLPGMLAAYTSLKEYEY